MQIEIKIDSSFEELKIIVLTDKMTDEIGAIVKKLSEESPQILAGFRENSFEILEQSDIIRIYAADGKVFAASSVIWEMENWSIVKQTGSYFIITAFTMFPIAYFANWMEHTLAGFLLYFGIFVILFFIMWSIQYFIWKIKINKVNSNLKK